MKMTKIQVSLEGLTPIMFDRYAGDNKTELEVQDKFYFAKDGKTLILPAGNLMSLLSAQNTMSAPKRFLDSRQYKKVAAAISSYVTVEPFDGAVFMANGLPIEFGGFDDKQFYVDQRVARLEKGIPNPKVRPVLDVPWELDFSLSVFENQDFTLKLLKDLISKSGYAIGLGTYRGQFGKYSLIGWDEEVVEI